MIVYSSNQIIVWVDVGNLAFLFNVKSSKKKAPEEKCRRKNVK